MRRAIATVALLTVVAGRAGAYPGDVFENAQPAQAPAAPASAPGEDPYGVSDQGAATYSIPIAVPPGRHGMAPSLALTYSSRSPVRGGLAAGWSLAMPRIEVDTTLGRLAGTEYRTGAGARLIRVDEPAASDAETFRADRDDTFTRYERVFSANGITQSWRVRTLDGRVRYFGEAEMSRDVPHAASAPGAAEARWFLTREVDRFGNEIRYYYQKAWSLIRDESTLVPVDIYPTTIEWGGATGRDSFARINFDYGTMDRCVGSWVPVGASFSWRTGFPLMEGARRLGVMRIEVRDGSTWTERRRYTLGYDGAELRCSDGRTHAPLRLLTSVQERVVAPDATAIDLPAQTFDYGRRELELTERSDMTPLASGTNSQAPQKAGGWPTLDSMLLDLDGDGNLDWLWSRPTADSVECGVMWQRNRGDGTFDPEATFTLPTNPWAGSTRDNSTDIDSREGCSLSHQFSRAANGDLVCGLPATYTSYRFMDLTGDGRPDLVTAIDSNRGRYRPEDDLRLWPDGPMTSCEGDEGACRDEDGEPMRCAVSSPVPNFSQVPVDDPPPDSGFCPEGTCPVQGCEGDDFCECAWEHCEPWDEQEPGRSSDYAPPIDHSGGFSVVDHMFWNGPGYSTGDQGKEGRTPTHQRYECAQQPEEQCGRFVWRVYRNTGAGFTEDPEIVMSPVPLESDRATSALGAGALAASSSWHGFIDMDGDAIPDAVFMTPFWSSDGVEPGAPPTSFQVFRGDGDGGFQGDASGDPYLWSAPTLETQQQFAKRARVTLSQSSRIPWPGLDDQRVSRVAVTLEDLNGDGLPDYVDARDLTTGGSHVRVFYNTGAGFETADPGSSLEVPAWNDEVLATLGENRQVAFDWRANGHLDRGWSRDVIRTVDIDADGLLDVVILPEPQAGLRNPWSLATQQERARVFVNVGDRLVPMGETDKLMEWWAALARIRLSSGHPFETPHWKIATDFLDLDGDGLPEAFNNDLYSASCTPNEFGDDFIAPCGYGDRSWTSPRDGQGMRLLRTVRTGTGAEIGFEYEPVTDGRVPHPLWVASRMTVSPGPAATGGASPTLVSTFEFTDPQYLPDERSSWAFRGFAETATTAPGGARTVKHFDHELDWTGPLVKSRVEDVPGHVDHFTDTAWEVRTLFGGAIATLHRVATETRTCGASQSPAACATGGALRVETDTWAGLTAEAAGSIELAHWIVESTVDDRLNTFVRRLHADTDAYWIVPIREERFEAADDGSWAKIGRIEHEWDPSWRAEVATHDYLDDVTAATTTRQVDLATGNVFAVRKPEQTAADANQWTKMDYDPHGLFVVATKNELGHAFFSTWDTATGAQLSQRGPNIKNGVLEGWVQTIDGLGRPLDRSAYIDDAVAGYVPVVVARNSYSEASDPANGGFQRTTAKQRIELTEDRWKTVTTDVDGLGRTAVTSEWVGITAVATERRSYDAASELSRIDAPSPAASAGTVAWLFGHDALGRPTSVDGPDGSGERWSYDGRWTTRSDYVGAAGGTGTVTRTLVDGFGQLVEVGEQHAPGQWETTHYGYDGNGAMTSIVDPDTVTTTMAHDWRGQRVRIRRGDRSWSYLYNRNGKLIATIAPVPAGGDPVAYTTTIAYDALDREVSRIAGSRALTAAQLAQQGAASVQRTYDSNVGDNGVGRLSKVTQPWGNTMYGYDARGLLRSRASKVAVAGVLAATGTEKRTYNALGTPRTITYADNHSQPSVVTFATNDRGLPASSTWGSNGLGSYTYSAAGGVMRRSGSRFEHLIERDARGRVTRQRVRSKISGVGMSTRAEATYGYDGAGHVETMTWGIAPGATVTPESFAFTYDGRGQLTGATGAAGYDASFWYSHGGRVTRASVTAPNAAMPVPARDVVYDYAIDDDWETPDALIAQDDSIWLGLVHDSSGNTTARTGTAGGSTLVHDGFDQLREVADADGREVYWYDGDRQRVGVATYTAAGTLARVRWNFGATEIVYQPKNFVEKTIAHVAHLGPVGRIENRIRLETVFDDQHDHTLAVLDTSGVLLAGFVYGPFGEILRQAGTQVGEINRRFNGKELDDTSGLYYYGYRYYDPLSLTWTQADPLYRLVPDLAWAEPRRALAYAFTLNNPLTYVDPDGLGSWNAENREYYRTYPERLPANGGDGPPVGLADLAEAAVMIYEEAPSWISWGMSILQMPSDQGPRGDGSVLEGDEEPKEGGGILVAPRGYKGKTRDGKDTSHEGLDTAMDITETVYGASADSDTEYEITFGEAVIETDSATGDDVPDELPDVTTDWGW